MDDIKTEKWTLDDGRRAEKRVTETISPTGEAERVIELHVEDERPLKLQQRVVERRKPIVYEREIQTVGKDGNVVEKKVEAVEPRTPMQLVEHSMLNPSVAAQSAEDCDCHVTKEEMIETIVTAMKAMREEFAVKAKDEESDKPYVIEEEPKKAVRKPFSRSINGPVASQGLAEEIGKRVGVSNPGTGDKVMWVVIAGLVVGLLYVLFGM